MTWIGKVLNFLGYCCIGVLLPYCLTELLSEQTPTPQEVVRSANELEYEWYRNLSSEEIAAKFRELVASPRYKDVADRVQRAICRGDTAKTSELEKLEFTDRSKIEGDTAIVYTKETSTLGWTPSGYHWQQKDNPHTYYLKRVNGRWTIERDDFKP